MHNIGLKIWSTNFDCYAKDAVDFCRKGICSYVELYVVPETLETLKLWKSLDVPYTIHCPHSAHGFNLSRKELRETNREIYLETKQFADELNADFIIFHGGMSGEIEETAAQLKDFCEPRALIENKPYKAIPGFYAEGITCVGYSPEQIAYIMKTAGCGFCLDFNHAVCAANSLKKGIYEELSSYISLNPTMYHVSDLNDESTEFDEHLNLGKGVLDLKRFMSLLPDNYKASLETKKNFKSSLSDFYEDVVYFKSLFER